MRITPSTALKQSRVTPRRGLPNLTNRIQPTAELGRATATMKTSRSPAASRAQPLPYIPPAQGSYQTDEQGQYEHTSSR